MPTELLSLARIFNNRLFRIPDYQRGYAWGSRQLIDFWSDLNRVGVDKTHYCGQLTLEKVEEKSWREWKSDTWLIKEADYEPYFVVDGQQRLTTAVILLQCLLEDQNEELLIAGQKVSELRERYLVKGTNPLRSCLFGYATDNPSHEFFRTQILGVPSNEYHGIRTVYTKNLEAARDFFREKLSKIDKPVDLERIFKIMAQRFRFNLHELNDDIDVFVAFETMNNRGKSLSRLELLKNRLIYLSTLAKGTESERKKVRLNINSVWRTVYEELGRNPDESLDDDEFLRAHWIVFFGYDKDEADPLSQFLLNRHFTTERLEQGKLTLNDIQSYADSLQISARVWQRLHFPEHHAETLGQIVSLGLIRLKRLNFGVLRPLLLAVLSTDADEEDILSTLQQAERFLLLVRVLTGTRSDVGEAESYRIAHGLRNGEKNVLDAVSLLQERVKRHFSIPVLQQRINNLFTDGAGYYDLPSLKFVLFGYEEYLRKKAKAPVPKVNWQDFRGSRSSVEHIYPQDPEPDEWPLFQTLINDEPHLATHSLGNLVALSVAKNASLSRRPFVEKKTGTTTIPGYSQGSFSELRIAQYDDWTPEFILQRGLEILSFVEERWDIVLGDEKEKIALLKLDFLVSSTTKPSAL